MTPPAAELAAGALPFGRSVGEHGALYRDASPVLGLATWKRSLKRQQPSPLGERAGS